MAPLYDMGAYLCALNSELVVTPISVNLINDRTLIQLTEILVLNRYCKYGLVLY